MSDPEYEAIEETSRYVLGSSADEFGIWDKLEPERPPERFPPTDDGFDEAAQRFRRLNRVHRVESGIWSRTLTLVILVAGAIWIVSGVTLILLQLATEGGAPIRVIAALDVFAFRVWVTAVAVAFALGVARRIHPGGGSSSLSGPKEPDVAGANAIHNPARRAVAGAVWLWMLGVGLLSWIIAGVVRQGFFSEPRLGAGLSFDPGGWYVWIRLIELIAFRLWIASAVALLVLYLGLQRRLRSVQ